MNEVSRQLSGIGGGRSLGFGANRVRSLPDGVAQVLDNYLKGREERMAAKAQAAEEEQPCAKEAEASEPEDAAQHARYATCGGPAATQDRRPVSRVRPGGGGE